MGAALPDRIAGRYVPEAVLGQGGMGVVYRVRDEREQRPLALKCVNDRGQRADRSRLFESFAREYRTLAQLSHPSVIQVFEYGQSELGPYYTMELLEGSDLQALSPLPWRTACLYLRDIASCLALLHSRRLLHRDVSPRNVRCTERGAKLLDFGAMAPMGPVHDVIGTPPLVPPEVLHRESLDGRCDLYALGATLYLALTGRHAYPARSFVELPSLWQHRPVPPSALAPDVPEALDVLAVSLLHQERHSRPRSAAEVFERLSAIAGLDEAEHLHVSRAYLTTPTLLGREAELERVRAVLAQIREQRCATAWFEGAAGVGRTRLLDAAMVEARLEGASVLRIDAQELGAGELVLARGLLERASDVLQRASSKSADARPPAADAPATPGVKRERLVSRVRALVRMACLTGPLVIAIDDADALDHASQALLATLPRAARRNLLLLVAAREDSALDPALAAMRTASEPVLLEPLAPAQTEALFRSLFGDVPGIAGVAARVHELSRGNPRASMELAEYLVATEKARYVLGGWVVPLELAREDLPEAWTTALDARIEALPNDQRELAEVLAHALDHGLLLEELDALTSHGDAARRLAALDGLLLAGMLRVDRGGAHYAFTSTAARERVRALTHPLRAHALHLRLAHCLRRRGGDAIEVARCQQLGGQHAGAIDTLLAELAKGSRWDTGPDDYAPVLLRAIDACSALFRPPKDRFVLVRELIRVGEHLGVAGLPRYYADLFQQLRRDSGLDDYAATPATLPAGERLQAAFAAAQARFEATPAHLRVLAPLEAITNLAMTTRQAAAFAATSLDYDLLEQLPDLTPFIALSPALATTVENTFPAARHLTAARYEEALRRYQVAFARLCEPDRAGLEPTFWHWSVHALQYALGHLNAGLGIAAALEHADRLARDPGWAIAAWDVRRAFYLRQGAWREAESCRDHIERMRVASGRRPPMVDTSARLEFDTHAHARDLVGVRRAMERLEELIALHPGYAVYRHHGPAVCELLRGNYPLALEHADRALACVAAGKHPTWPWIANCRLEVLFRLGRYEDVRSSALQYLAEARAAGLMAMADNVTLPLALAEAKLGDYDTAIARIDAAIAHRVELGSRGLNLGSAYETRARVAIWMQDAEAFRVAAQACAIEYGQGRGGSSFAGKYEALRAEARLAGLSTASDVPAPPPAPVAAGVSSSSISFDPSSSFEEQAAAALEHLVREARADGGVLYQAVDGALVQCANLGTLAVPAHARELASTTLGSAGELDATAMRTSIERAPARREGPVWLPAALGYYERGSYLRTGVAVLSFRDGEPRALPLELIEAVAHLLRPRAEG